MYKEQIIRAGRTEEHALYHSIRYNQNGSGKGEKRAKRSKPTSERQALVNRKRAERILTRLLNANFGRNDLYATWTFSKDKRPGDPERFKQTVQALLKALRKLFGKLGIPFRYIWVGERGERGAEHIHMVMTGIDIRMLQPIWPYGYVTCANLDPSGSYRKLAAYFIKYSDKTMKTEGRLQGKRYNPSHGLIHPEPEKTRIRKRKTFRADDIKVPAGWYLERDTVECGISDVTGYEYLYYTLVMLPDYIPTKSTRKLKS
nr:MAG TPA: protein of unknown function DUF1424 [Caudoviricetes sp.]